MLLTSSELIIVTGVLKENGPNNPKERPNASSQRIYSGNHCPSRKSCSSCLRSLCVWGLADSRFYSGILSHRFNSADNASDILFATYQSILQISCPCSQIRYHGCIKPNCMELIVVAQGYRRVKSMAYGSLDGERSDTWGSEGKLDWWDWEASIGFREDVSYYRIASLLYVSHWLL